MSARSFRDKHTRCVVHAERSVSLSRRYFALREKYSAFSAKILHKYSKLNIINELLKRVTRTLAYLSFFGPCRFHRTYINSFAPLGNR